MQKGITGGRVYEDVKKTRKKLMMNAVLFVLPLSVVLSHRASQEIVEEQECTLLDKKN